MLQADIVVRIAAVTVALLLLAGLTRDARNERLVAYFALFALGLVGFLAGNTPSADLKLSGAFGMTLSLLSGFNAIFLWWFALAIFDDDFRPGLLEGGIGALWFVVAAANKGALGKGFASLPLNPILLVMATGIVLHLCCRLWRDREGDLVPDRRRARGVLAAALAGLLGLDVAIDLVAGAQWKPQWLTLSYNTVVLIILIWLTDLLTRFQLAPLRFEPRASLAQSITVGGAPAPPEASALAARVKALVTETQDHLDPDLTFAAFVAKTGHPEADVRRHINHVLGFRHFRAFLNAHRVAEARRLLADPKRSNDKIAAIAFDAGFASLASFHRAFSTIEGESPGAFRTRRMAQSQRNISSEIPISEN